MRPGRWARLRLAGEGGRRFERLVERSGLEAWWASRRQRSGWPRDWPLPTRMHLRPARWFRVTPSLFLEVPVRDLEALADALAHAWTLPAAPEPDGEAGLGPPHPGRGAPLQPEDLAILRPGDRLRSAEGGSCRVVRVEDQGRQVVVEDGRGERRAIRAADLLRHYQHEESGPF